MKAESSDSDFFQALVLFQVKAVAFGAAAKGEDKAYRATAMKKALETLSVEGFREFLPQLGEKPVTEVATLGCDKDYVLCHGVCMQSC